MNKKDTRLFNPVRVRHKSKAKTVILGILAAVAVLIIAAAVYISQTGTSDPNKVIRKAGELLDSVKSDDDSKKEKAEKFENANINILLMSVSSEPTQESGSREIYFMVIAHADAATGQIKFCPISVRQSYVDVYESGGAEAVTKAVAGEYGINLTKYVSSNENTFALALNYMGGLEYTVPERVEYRTPDLTLILTPGKQTIKGEVLVKYLKYFKEKDLSKQGELFCTMVNNYFTAGNFENAMDVYKGVIRNLSGTSNISFVETADNLEYIKTVIDNTETKAVTVSSVGEFENE